MAVAESGLSWGEATVSLQGWGRGRAESGDRRTRR